MKIHKSITLDRVMAAIDDYHANCIDPGFCIACGADADGCEPDARQYPCHDCGENAVYGVEELAFYL